MAAGRPGGPARQRTSAPSHAAARLPPPLSHAPGGAASPCSCCPAGCRASCSSACRAPGCSLEMISATATESVSWCARQAAGSARGPAVAAGAGAGGAADLRASRRRCTDWRSGGGCRGCCCCRTLNSGAPAPPRPLLPCACSACGCGGWGCAGAAAGAAAAGGASGWVWAGATGWGRAAAAWPGPGPAAAAAADANMLIIWRTSAAAWGRGPCREQRGPSGDGFRPFGEAEARTTSRERCAAARPWHCMQQRRTGRAQAPPAAGPARPRLSPYLVSCGRRQGRRLGVGGAACGEAARLHQVYRISRPDAWKMSKK
jgi:hypothetical protein